MPYHPHTPLWFSPQQQVLLTVEEYRVGKEGTIQERITKGGGGFSICVESGGGAVGGIGSS